MQHYMKSTGYFPGESKEWYTAEGICSLDNGPQRWWTKHTTREIDFGARRLEEEEQGEGSETLSNSWLPEWASTRNWKYVLQAPDEHVLEVWERDDIDVHIVYTRKKLEVTECCWYEPEYVHEYCLAGLGQLTEVGTGIDGTTKWRKDYVGGPVGRPFIGTACNNADDIIVPPGFESRVGEMEDHSIPVAAPWFNEKLFSKLVDPRAEPPTTPPGYTQVEFIDFHMDGNTIKRIDYVSGGTPNGDDGNVEWYEIMEEHTATPPSDAEELLTPPEVVNSREECIDSIGEQVRVPWTSWLWLLAAAAVAAGVCGAAYYNQAILKKEQNDGSFGAFPKDGGYAGGMSSGSRMSGKSGMTRGSGGDGMSTGTRATQMSGMTRVGDDDFYGGGGNDNRMTGVSKFSRVGDDDDLSADPEYFSDNPGNRMTGISAFTRGGDNKSHKSNASRSSSGSKRSKGSKSHGSRRSKGSKSHGSRRSKSGKSHNSARKHH